MEGTSNRGVGDNVGATGTILPRPLTNQGSPVFPRPYADVFPLWWLVLHPATWLPWAFLVCHSRTCLSPEPAADLACPPTRVPPASVAGPEGLCSQEPPHPHPAKGTRRHQQPRKETLLPPFHLRASRVNCAKIKVIISLGWWITDHVFLSFFPFIGVKVLLAHKTNKQEQAQEDPQDLPHRSQNSEPNSKRVEEQVLNVSPGL